MVYELLPKAVIRPIPLADCDAFYYDFARQPNLLQTCRCIKDEAEPALRTHRLLAMRLQKCIIGGKVASGGRLASSGRVDSITSFKLLPEALAAAHSRDSKFLRNAPHGRASVPRVDDVTIRTTLGQLKTELGNHFHCEPTVIKAVELDASKQMWDVFHMLVLQL